MSKLIKTQIDIYFDHKNANNHTYLPDTKKNLDMVCIGACQSLEIYCKKMTAPNIKGKIFRLRLDRHRLSEVFSNIVPTKNTQRWPLQIVITTDKENKKLVENVWIDKIDWTYLSENFVICQGINFSAEREIQINQ